MKVRKINIDETDFLEDIHDHQNFTHYQKKVEDRIFRRTADVYILELEDKIIGEITVQYGERSPLETIPGKRVYFSALRIKEAYRGKGYGKFFLGAVISDLRKNNYTEFTIGVISTNEKAKHIYKTLGFRKTIARMNEIYEGDRVEYNLLLCDKL